MLDKIQKALLEATEFVKGQANSIGDGAKDRAYKIIDEWMQVFPKLEQYGLRLNSFALSVAISPALEVEMVGQHELFPPERLDEIIQQVKGNAALASVFTTIRTTYNMQRKINPILNDPLIVKLKIRISPEIKVFIGEPMIE